MTLLQVKNQLITLFFSQDSFEFKRDQLKVEFDKDSADFREPLLREALTDLEKLGIVKKMVVGEEPDLKRESWILAQPLFTFNQSVTVSSLAASVVADTINQIADIFELNLSCDKTQLTEQDLLKLCAIIDHLMDGEDDEPGAPGEDET